MMKDHTAIALAARARVEALLAHREPQQIAKAARARVAALLGL